MKTVLLVVGILLFGVFLWAVVDTSSQLFLTQPDIEGGPVRIGDAQGDRIYYLTTQWEKRVSRVGGPRSSSGRRTVSWLFTDLWALDAATAQPVFRKRLKRDKVNADSTAMGVDQGVLWARIPELVGIRLVDGVIVADSARIEARNPALAGLMPKPPQDAIFLTESMQPLKFDPDAGLVVLLADARKVRIDPLSLAATPYVPRSDPDRRRAPTSGSALKAPLAPRLEITSLSNGMDWSAMVRGVPMQGSGRSMIWLGLLSETELEGAIKRRTIGNQMDFSTPSRHRLYRAELKPIEDFFGPRLQFLDPVVLPESPDFLMAGLLTQDVDSTGAPAAMWRREPDSVFVLSRDRLGEEGRLQLARITGPAGRPAWSTALPLSAMSAWLPGERDVLMLGPAPSEPRSPMAEEGEDPAMQILSIDLGTGALRSFNPDLHRDWPVDADVQQASP